MTGLLVGMLGCFFVLSVFFVVNGFLVHYVGSRRAIVGFGAGAEFCFFEDS